MKNYVEGGNLSNSETCTSTGGSSSGRTSSFKKGVPIKNPHPPAYYDQLDPYQELHHNQGSLTPCYC